MLLACEADPALGRRVRAQLGETGVPASVAAEILTDVRAAGGVQEPGAVVDDEAAQHGLRIAARGGGAHTG